MIDAGARVLCAACGSELMVALDKATASAKGVHRGIYCPKDPRHVTILSH